jgi:hypothetical protein
MRFPEKKTEPDRKRDFDPRRHPMLSHCFFKVDALLWIDLRNKIPQKEILLTGADLQGARLMGIKMHQEHKKVLAVCIWKERLWLNEM